MKLKAKVDSISYGTTYLEFGRVQADMGFSSRGSIARKLKLKEGDVVEVSLRKLRRN